MGLLTRFWSRDRFARNSAAELLGAAWLVQPGTLDPIASRLIAQANALPKAEIRAAYEQYAAEQKLFAADMGARGRAADESLVVVDGVAVISVAGLMMKEVPSAFSLFGEKATSTVHARLQLDAANKRDDVRSILLMLDTPGGMVDGTDALASDIASSQKPVHAYAADLAASAGIWISSQAARFSVGRTASIGSVGVYTVIDDTSKLYEEAGVKSHLVSSGGVKGGLEQGIQISEEVLADVQRRIDSIADLFVAAVAEGRGLSVADVRKLATGHVWHGAEAVARGLADAVETDDQAFEAAKAAAGTKPTSVVGNALASDASTSAKPGAKESDMNLSAIYAKLEKGEKLTAEEQKFLRQKAGEPAPSIETRADVPDDVRRELAAVEARNQSLAKEVAEMKAAQKRTGYLAEASKLKFVPGLSSDEIADELAAADSRSPEAGAKVRKHFATVNEAMKSSKAFEAFGSTRSGDDSPMGQLKAKAAAIRAAKPKLSELEALAEAGEQNPDLYEAAQGLE